MSIELRQVELPSIAVPEATPQIPESEFEERANRLREQAGTEWVAVYGDREHNANLIFLTNFDPRFEEAMLLLGPADTRVLLVGNEGMVHAQEARLPLDVRLYQPFSLMAQPRGESPPLVELLREAGMRPGSSVGVAGWKYLAHGDIDDDRLPAYVPTFVNRAIELATGIAPIDITSALMNPVGGLRSVVSAHEIARLEWGAARASAAVLRVVRGARPGMSEHEIIGNMGYEGEPMSCHPIVASSDGSLNGLRSPTARRPASGDAISVGIGYWGGLCCRAGLLTDVVDEAFLAAVVRPYFNAIATWWSSIRIGVTGGELHDAVISGLGDADFRPMLNPGHLTSYDEWVHSPIRPGSSDAVRSGMVFQCDIIPTPLPPGRALNCEDTAAIADEPLRDELARDFPELWERIQARRAFMRDELGITLHPEVMPLSVAPAYLPPFWLVTDLVCVVTG